MSDIEKKTGEPIEDNELDNVTGGTAYFRDMGDCPNWTCDRCGKVCRVSEEEHSCPKLFGGKIPVHIECTRCAHFSQRNGGYCCDLRK